VWSPDGRTLAYIASINGRFQVLLRGIGATQSTQLTNQGIDGVSLFWSPDGSRIYFTRMADHNLVSVSPGGGEPQVIATPVPEDAVGRLGIPAGGLKACLSPDGSTLVFGRSDAQGVRLWSKDLRTGQAHALTLADMPRPLANIQALAFSPDGKRLGVIASATALNDARGVWMISWPAGSARLMFADAPYLASNPALSWLPDSRRFVMNGYPLHGGANRLLVADVDAGTLNPLTGGKDDKSGPSVSSDGRRIAFVSRRSGLDLIQFPLAGGPPEPLLATSRSESHPDISRSGMLAYVTDADGTPEVRVRSGSDGWPRTIGGASGPAQDRATQPYNVRLSPDSQRIAVEAYGSDHLIWIYPTAGGPPVRLDSDTTDQHGPSWSPDGNWIAYRRLRSGNWEIVKAPPGGGAVVRLDDASPGGGSTDWSPGGEWIAHDRLDGMHLISPDGTSSRVLAGRIPFLA
jgi:Tol biopolymer transport system component